MIMSFATFIVFVMYRSTNSSDITRAVPRTWQPTLDKLTLCQRAVGSHYGANASLPLQSFAFSSEAVGCCGDCRVILSI